MSFSGFHNPPDVLADSKLRDDNIFRFTFHGRHSEDKQEPECQLSQEDLSIPLKEPVGKILWIKVDEYVRHSFDTPSFTLYRSLPHIANLINVHMQPTEEDKSNVS